MMSKKLPQANIEVLMNMQATRLERSVFRSVFRMSGVKQGGVVSLVLFCLYLDGLLVKLATEKCCCFVGFLA